MVQQNIKIMSKECKTARNVVSVAFVILATIILMMSSCSSGTYLPCGAYTMSPNGTGGSCSR